MNVISKEGERFYFVGIGGIGMSALAHFLLHENNFVAGCDNDITQKTVLQLQKKNVSVVNESDCIEHIELHKPSILVTTHTVKKSHPALSWALDNSIPVINRAELLAYYTNNKITIGITGSHGKTSTTALIGHIFNVAQKNSSIFVGGFMHSIDSNIVTQSSPLIILEADDAYKSFLHLTPHTSVITSIGYEHLETYTDWNDIYNSFLQYALQTKEEGHVVLNAECQHVRKIAPLCQKNVILCGFSPSYDFSASITTENSFYTNVNFYEKGIYTISCQLPFIGKHMIGNAITAYAVARLHNIDQEAIKKGLESHKGVERRFQSVGFFKGHKVFDDYGHHPTEIENVLKTCRIKTKGRVTIFFQPHKYSRTALLWDEFIRVFSQYSPDHLVITDIFGAFEDVQSNCSPQKMAKELSEKGISCIYVSFEKLYEYAITLSAHSSEDIIMTLGAGKLDLLALQLCSYNDINNNNNNNSIKTNVIL